MLSERLGSEGTLSLAGRMVDSALAVVERSSE
jgi:hypothetical protein